MVSGKNSIFLITSVSVMAFAPAILIESQIAGTELLHPQTTFLMALTGLLYILYAMNRRLCLATLTVPLGSGRARFHSILQFNSKVSNKLSRRKILTKGARCLQNDIESTQNIGSHPNSAGLLNEQLSLENIDILDKYQQEPDKEVFPKFTITHFSPLSLPALIRMAPRAEQNLSFSPGFIFVQLARGPPKPT